MLDDNFNKEFEKHGFVKEIFDLEKGIGSSKLFDFYDETTTFGIMCKLEKMNSYSRILNIQRCVFLNILAVGIEKEENRKKGFFKNVIEKLEKFCKTQGITLFVSNILEYSLVKTFNKNGFGIISYEEYTNDVSISKDMLRDEIIDDLLKKSYEIHSFKIFEEKNYLYLN